MQSRNVKERLNGDDSLTEESEDAATEPSLALSPSGLPSQTALPLQQASKPQAILSSTCADTDLQPHIEPSSHSTAHDAHRQHHQERAHEQRSQPDSDPPAAESASLQQENRPADKLCRPLGLLRGTAQGMRAEPGSAQHGVQGKLAECAQEAKVDCDIPAATVSREHQLGGFAAAEVQGQLPVTPAPHVQAGHVVPDSSQQHAMVSADAVSSNSLARDFRQGQQRPSSQLSAPPQACALQTADGSPDQARQAQDNESVQLHQARHSQKLQHVQQPHIIELAQDWLQAQQGQQAQQSQQAQPQTLQISQDAQQAQQAQHAQQTQPSQDGQQAYLAQCQQHAQQDQGPQRTPQQQQAQQRQRQQAGAGPLADSPASGLFDELDAHIAQQLVDADALAKRAQHANQGQQAAMSCQQSFAEATAQDKVLAQHISSCQQSELSGKPVETLLREKCQAPACIASDVVDITGSGAEHSHLSERGVLQQQQQQKQQQHQQAAMSHTCPAQLGSLPQQSACVPQQGSIICPPAQSGKAALHSRTQHAAFEFDPFLDSGELDAELAQLLDSAAAFRPAGPPDTSQAGPKPQTTDLQPVPEVSRPATAALRPREAGSRPVDAGSRPSSAEARLSGCQGKFNSAGSAPNANQSRRSSASSGQNFTDRVTHGPGEISSLPASAGVRPKSAEAQPDVPACHNASAAAARNNGASADFRPALEPAGPVEDVLLPNVVSLM